MNYASIRSMDIANGEGIRVSIFVSGCTNKCVGCFNSEAQDFEYGKLYTKNTERQILNQISKKYVRGLSVLGGDPLCQDEDGLKQLISLVKSVDAMGKTTWLWTGFIWEDILNDSYPYLQSRLVSLCDVVVDGPFIEAQKDLTLKWRGSSNQRVIDVEKTLLSKSNNIVLYEE